MKFFSVIVLCIVILFNVVGYSQFKTTSFAEMASEENWAKTIILEGYAYLAETTTYLPAELYGYKNDYWLKGLVPVLVEHSVGLLIDKMPHDRYVLLDMGKFYPLGRGIFKTRIKGIVNGRDCDYDIISLDVINYGLAIQEKEYKREGGRYEITKGFYDYRLIRRYLFRQLWNRNHYIWR